jgi:hypothetical protein
MVTILNDSKVNARSMANLGEIERLTGFKLTVIKGQKIATGKDASAGTHDGYGVVDLRANGFSNLNREVILKAARATGNAGWLRTVAQGFDAAHFHLILMGDPDLSPSARQQVTAYRQGKNGLKNDGPDDGPEGFTGVTWESYQKAHPQEDDMTPEQAVEMLKLLGTINTTLAGMNARIGVLANNMAPNVDRIADKYVGPN